MPPKLILVIPCYNEEAVLPVTCGLFRNKLEQLVSAGKIARDSRVLFVNDGSRDQTWEIISGLAKEDARFSGISLSRNRGHQNALLAGLMEAKEDCDIAVSMDCDGQDDVNAVDKMVDAFLDGADIVYGVRSAREKDSFFKRTTALGFYRVMNRLGVESVYNHADYRLMSKRALEALAQYKEVNLYLRGMVPMVGFRSTCVEYERAERMAGESKYPLRKMLSLALEGITSLSVKPIHLVMGMGLIVAALSFLGVIWSIVMAMIGRTVAGWASMVSIICFVSGVQLVSLGMIGEYVGKIYLEVKQRPRFIIAERTGSQDEDKD